MRYQTKAAMLRCLSRAGVRLVEVGVMPASKELAS